MRKSPIDMWYDCSELDRRRLLEDLSRLRWPSWTLNLEPNTSCCTLGIARLDISRHINDFSVDDRAKTHRC